MHITSASGCKRQRFSGRYRDRLLNLPAGWNGTQASQIGNLVVDPTNLTPPQLFLWQAQKFVTIFPCGSDGLLFTAIIATYANNWLWHGRNVTRTQLNRMSLHCDLAYPQIPMIYRLLHGGGLFKPEAFPAFKDSYETRLDKAPQCGIYNYGGSNYANDEWSSPDRNSEARKRISLNGGSGSNTENAEYPGIDYMSIFNLHVLNKGSYASFYNNPYYREHLSQVYPYLSGTTMRGNTANPTYLRYLEYLSTTSHVTPPGRVTYRSAKQIVLLPGFKADIGSNFKAFIKDFDCSGCHGPSEPFPGGGTENLSYSGDPFIMDTVEDVVQFNPYPIPSADTNDYEMTDAELQADSIDIYQQILATGDSEVISAVQTLFTGSGGNNANRQSNNLGTGFRTNNSNRSLALGSSGSLSGRKGAISLYPNPNSGSFDIMITLKGTYDVKVTNMYGVTIYKSTITSDVKKHISLDGFPPGNYMVNIVGDGVTYTERVIILQ